MAAAASPHSLQDSGNEPEADRVRQRLTAMVDHVAAYLRKNPDLVEATGLMLDAAIAQLPRPAEQDLAKVLPLFPHLVDDGGTIRPLSQGGWLHNAFHAAGWTH
ncbi:hypothetical protein [Micromonospora sp. B9E7]|uniref:hypothetical protein n=1 Tax=Micromonospora sp. B9E7 TaxID=3153574 RepID=UPI00325F53AD